MEFKLKTRSIAAELIVTCGNATITEDVAEMKNGSGYIPDSFIEQLFSVVMEMYHYNSKSDVEFAKYFYEVVLTHSERAAFLEQINEEAL